jgi:YVTN family beta-propeller protein
MRSYRTLIVTGLVLAALIAASFPARRHARKHVNWITAVEDHPLNCLSCHLYRKNDGFFTRILNAQYVSPYNLALSADGRTLYVVAQEGNALLLVDAFQGNIRSRIALGEKPHSVALSRDGNTAYVSIQWADYIAVVDLREGRVVDSLRGGNGPAGLSLTPGNEYLYAVNSYSSDISVYDLADGKEIRRLKAGNNPTGAGISPDGKQVYITSRRSLPVPYGDPPMTELTVVGTDQHRVEDRRIFESAYIMENVEVTPQGDLAVATLIRPKNLIPAIQVERGWMMTHGIGIIERKENGRTIQLLLDEPNSYYPDPFDVAIDPDGKRAFVSHSGIDMLTVVDLDEIRRLLEKSSPEELQTYSNHLGVSSRYVSGRIPTGANPKGLSVSPDGKTLYVAERLEDRITVVDLETMSVKDHIDLGGPRRITVARQGRRVFNNASHTFHNQYACYTCHPDAHEDGLVYNMAASQMGRNLANVQTLRDIGQIPPYKWNGKNQTVYKQDGMRFSTVLTRTESFSYDDLDALVAYIVTGIQNPPNFRYNPEGELSHAQERGREIFYRTHDNFGKEIPEGNRCYTCHPPPYFTNMEMVDVGTLSETDDPMLLDVPQLNNIYESPPYLHDGRASTLEELWTTFNDNDEHGVGNDMTKMQLNDLVEYLKSLRNAEYYQAGPEVYHASAGNKKD